MSTKIKLIIGFTSLIVAFASGRYLSPTKVVTEIKTVEVEKKETDTQSNQNKHKETDTREITHPDGTKETDTKTVEDDTDKTNTTEKDKVSQNTDSTKEVTRSGSRTTLSALGGIKLPGSPEVVYGGMIQKDVLGPVGIGVWGLNNGTVGASVGLSF